jgi:hypothetical protein
MYRRLGLIVTATMLVVAVVAPVDAQSVPATASQANAPFVAIGDAEYFLARGGWVSCQILKRDATLARREMARIKRVVFALKDTSAALIAVKQGWDKFDTVYARMVSAGTLCPTSARQRANVLGFQTIGAVEGLAGQIAMATMFAGSRTNGQISVATAPARAFMTSSSATQHSIARSVTWATGEYPLSFGATISGRSSDLSYAPRLSMYNRAYLAGDRSFAADLFPDDR